MARQLVPPPILRPARPHRASASSCRRRRMTGPGLVLGPVTLAALDQATKLGPVAEAAPVEVTNPAQVLAPLTGLVPAMDPAEVVATKSRFGDE